MWDGVTMDAQQRAQPAEPADGQAAEPQPTRPFYAAFKHARRIVVLVIGATVMLVGVALLVLPGPATIVLPAGLAILATEFVWARRLLRKARDGISSVGTSLWKAQDKRDSA